MRQKIPLFDRRRGASTTPITPNTQSSFRMPWRSRKKEEPKQPSASQSEFNSIRVNTADYRSLGLLRQYDDDRINSSSISQPTSERDPRPNLSNTTHEIERCPSDNPTPSQERNPKRRPDECLFLTSGYRVNAKGSPIVKELFSSTKDLSDEYEDGILPFPEHSAEGLLLRGKWCLIVLFLVFAFGTVIGLSWYASKHASMKSSVHAFVNANPVARLLGFLGGSDTSADARSMWINHVVKNDDNQILIAETFESRLNAEITPLLEKYMGKIWDSASSSPFICHGDDRLMVAFSVTKAASMPASITYETPCMIGPSSRSCVVKKQIVDVRDLVIRLPSQSSRYMHAVHVEIDHTSIDHKGNSSEARHIQDLGTISGQFRVELSDAARLALQRYCGQNKRAYSEDLMTELVSERNTRLINVYELKRLYALLSNHSDAQVSRSRAWDTRMLSTVVIDPLEHSRHSLAPIHVQQLLAHLRGVELKKAPHTSQDSPSPHISVSKPRKGEQPSEIGKQVESTASSVTTKAKLDSSLPSFNFQSPLTSPSTAIENSGNYSAEDSNAPSKHEIGHEAPSELRSSLMDEQESDDVENDSTEDNTKTEQEDKEIDVEQETSGPEGVTSQNTIAAETGPILRHHEESGVGPQKVLTSKESVLKKNESGQPSELSSIAVSSKNAEEPSPVSREENGSHGSAFAHNSSLPITRSAATNALIPSAASQQVFPSVIDRYRGDPPSTQKLEAPASLQPSTMTTKPLESSGTRSDLSQPPLGDTHQRGAGQSSFAGSLTHRSNPLGQQSKLPGSSGVPQTRSVPSSSGGQLPPFEQRAKIPPQTSSSLTAQKVFASYGKPYAMNEGTGSVSPISPRVVNNFPRTHGNAISGGARLSSSTKRVLDSSSGSVGLQKNENSKEGSLAAGALRQPALPRSVARTQALYPIADHYVQESLKAKTASGAALRKQPINVISIMNRKNQDRPAD